MTEQKIETVARRSLHPLLAIAAVAVAATALIAAAQFLWQAQTEAMNRHAGQRAVAATGKGSGPTERAAPAHRAQPAQSERRAAAPACNDCGVVVAVREVKQPGQATGVGAVAGGVVGGVVGNQFGGGRGKDAMTAIGVVGGAIAGHEIEKQSRAQTVYHVEVKMEDGSTRSFTQPAPLAVGAKVRIDGRQLVLRG